MTPAEEEIHAALVGKARDKLFAMKPLIFIRVVAPLIHSFGVDKLSQMSISQLETLLKMVANNTVFNDFRAVPLRVWKQYLGEMRGLQ